MEKKSDLFNSGHWGLGLSEEVLLPFGTSLLLFLSLIYILITSNIFQMFICSWLKVTDDLNFKAADFLLRNAIASNYDKKMSCPPWRNCQALPLVISCFLFSRPRTYGNWKLFRTSPFLWRFCRHARTAKIREAPPWLVSR